MTTLSTTSPLLLLALTACSPDKEADTGLPDTDAADTDTAADDTATEDTGANDTGTVDTGTVDTGTDDTGSDDTGTDDTSTVDTASPYANCGESGTGTAGDSWNATYDADGRMTVYNFNTSSTSGRTLYVWDAAGNMLETSTDNSFDGSVDVRTVYTYDERNNPVTYEFFRFEALDDSWERTYTYGEDTLTIYASDTYPTLGPPTRYDYTFDAQGNITTFEIDYGDDGTVEDRLVTTYTYDANDNMLTSEIDSGVDGVVDRANAYTYDAEDRMLTRTETYPSTMPGLYTLETWEYDAAGNNVLYRYQGISYSYTVSTTYDSAGRVTVRQTVYDGGRPYTASITYSCP